MSTNLIRTKLDRISPCLNMFGKEYSSLPINMRSPGQSVTFNFETPSAPVAVTFNFETPSAPVFNKLDSNQIKRVEFNQILRPVIAVAGVDLFEKYNLAKENHLDCSSPAALDASDRDRLSKLTPPSTPPNPLHHRTQCSVSLRLQLFLLTFRTSFCFGKGRGT